MVKTITTLLAMVFILLALVFVNTQGYMIDINVMPKCLVARLCGNTMLALIFIHDLTLCNFCSFTETKLSIMKPHFQTIQRRKKYTCNRCDRKVTSNNNLQEHNTFTHERMRLDCNKCDLTKT